MGSKTATGKKDRGGKDQIHMKSPVIVELQAGPSGFTDDKDEAKRIRVDTLLPTLKEKRRIILDFAKVKSSTQSFVHALLGEVLQRHGAKALEQIEFRKCNPLMKSLVQLVVDYSLGGFRSDSDSDDMDAERTLSGREPLSHGKTKAKGIRRAS